jgi:hypothetical protein
MIALDPNARDGIANIKGDEVMEREETYTDDFDGLTKTYADFDELVRLLKLAHHVHDAGYTKLGSKDLMLVLMGTKLFQGKFYGVTTNDPKSLRRPIAFARHIGATVEMMQPGGITKKIIDEIAERGGTGEFTVIFRPPSVQ